MQPIILASASPRRKHLLKLTGLPFYVHPSKVDEPNANGEKPADYAEKLAQLKAVDVAQEYSDALIIGADTIVVLGNEILGKPVSKQDAHTMLQKLSGETHDVITGVSLIFKFNGTIDQKLTFHATTSVTFSVLSDAEISTYIATGSPFDKAGGYGIQDDTGALFIERIDGDYYNVVGFPLNLFYNHLKAIKPEFFSL